MRAYGGISMLIRGVLTTRAQILKSEFALAPAIKLAY